MKSPFTFNRDKIPSVMKNDEADAMRDHAIFVCEDRDYMVLASKDKEFPFLAVIGAQCLNEDRTKMDRFEVNYVLPCKFRDEAITCALYYAVNDAGHEDSAIEQVVQIARFMKPY